MSQSRKRLTPTEFRAHIKSLGWTYRALAAWWDVSEVWVSKIARNADRPRQWDDAARGLPRRKDVGELAIQKRIARHSAGSGFNSIPPALPNAYRYRDELVVGAVVILTQDFGSLAGEGERGMVMAALADPETYTIQFDSTGAKELFTPDMVDEYFVFTGIVGSSSERKAHDRLP